MDKQLIEDLQKKLEASKKELEETLGAFATKDPGLKGDWDTRMPDFGPPSLGDLEQESDKMEEYENKLPVEHALELKLRDVNNALKKIEGGAYGICEKCGKSIEEERLRTIPEALVHVRCS